jgi:hypothetical protein
MSVVDVTLLNHTCRGHVGWKCNTLEVHSTFHSGASCSNRIFDTSWLAAGSQHSEEPLITYHLSQ